MSHDPICAAPVQPDAACQCALIRTVRADERPIAYSRGYLDGLDGQALLDSLGAVGSHE